MTWGISQDRIVLALRNGHAAERVTVTPGAYPHGAAQAYDLAPGQAATGAWRIDGSSHWYDLIVTVRSDPAWSRRLSGHMETGRASRSDPAIG